MDFFMYAFERGYGIIEESIPLQKIIGVPQNTHFLVRIALRMNEEKNPCVGELNNFIF